MMHVAADVEDMHWSDFPGIRATLARWGLLPEGSPREAVGKIGLNIGKILYPRADPVSAMLPYLDAHPADLVVLATHQREGMARWLHRAVAEPVARRAGTMTLFIPQDVEGFIALDDGAVTLRRMLIPLDKVPRPQAALDVAAGLARTFGCHEVSFMLVYVGATGDMPAVHEPRHAGWTWDRTVRRGDVVEQILDVGTAGAADCPDDPRTPRLARCLPWEYLRAYPARRPVPWAGYSSSLGIQEIPQKGKVRYAGTDYV